MQWNDGHFLKWVEGQCILKAGPPDSRGAGEGTGTCHRHDRECFRE